MKLLILTQKIDLNDDVLGFMHGWIEEFAKHCENVIVICLQKGEYNLPENVKILSLGKEKFKIKNLKLKIIKKLIYVFNFLRYIWHERRHYDYVWVHMNPEYVVLGGVLWRLWGKKIGLWYAHGHVSFILKIAAFLSHIIFTSTASGFRLPSRKLKIVGQGIDITRFKIKDEKLKTKEDGFKIITVGRISPAKDLETLVVAAEILAKENRTFQIEIIGGAGLPKQETYLAKIKGLVEEKGLGGLINFRGPVANKNILNYLQAADLFVNMSQTGSLDKAILEAMACGLPIVSCNQAIADELAHDPRFIFESKNATQLAQKIVRLMDLCSHQPSEFAAWGRQLREVIINRHSLAVFVKKILGGLKRD